MNAATAAAAADMSEHLGGTVAECTEKAMLLLAEYRATGRPVCWGNRPPGRLESCLLRDLRMLALTIADIVELIEVAEEEQP